MNWKNKLAAASDVDCAGLHVVVEHSGRAREAVVLVMQP